MKSDATKARNCAVQLLEKLKITAAPVPIERIIKKEGILLQYAPLEEDLSGMAFVRDGQRIIGINALHHPNRQRFSAAHELGHHLLHSPEIEQAVHVDKGQRILFRDPVSTQGTDKLEIEANTFASELLMPRTLVLREVDEAGIDIDDLAHIESLAKKFRVSPSAMSYRLALLTTEVPAA